MSKGKKSTKTKVAETTKVINSAQSVIESHYGKPNKVIRDAISEYTLKNKVAIACLYHAICAIHGLQRGTALTKLNVYTNALEKKAGGYISEIVKDKAGTVTLAVKDSYSQQSKFGWLYGEKSTVSNQNWSHNLRQLASSEFAKVMANEVAKDAQFAKASNFKTIEAGKLESAITAIADKA